MGGVVEFEGTREGKEIKYSASFAAETFVKDSARGEAAGTKMSKRG
jgi:hypothetical protein